MKYQVIEDFNIHLDFLRKKENSKMLIFVQEKDNIPNEVTQGLDFD